MLTLVRYIVSLVFIFSGFVKAIDPWGTAYKINEYVITFINHSISEDITLLFSVLLISIEFLLGIFLFLGIRVKFTTRVLPFFLLAMTILTTFNLFDKGIHDCGCFGDAIHLSNEVTFAKNVILLLLSIYLFIRKYKINTLILRSWHWIISTYNFIFILVVCLVNIYYLPMIDFRPFKIGVDIMQDKSLPLDAELPEYSYQFVYEKEGTQKTFTDKNLPDSTWKMVSRHVTVVKEGTMPKILNFRIQDENGEDIQDELLEDTTITFLMLSVSLDNMQKDVSDKMNTIYDYCRDNGYHFYCITASSIDIVNQWRYYDGLDCRVFTADPQLIQTMSRANPSLMLLKKGVIINKWSCFDLPDIDEDTSLNALSGNIGSKLEICLKTILYYLIPLIILIIVKIINDRRKKKLKTP